MGRFMITSFSAIVIIVLVLTFMPLPGEADAVYTEYMNTRQYSTAKVQDKSGILYEKFEKEIKESGKFTLNFPLQVGVDNFVAVTSEVGKRNVSNGSGWHQGVDLGVSGNPLDIPVVSATDGTVKVIKYQGPVDSYRVGAGNYIMIETKLPSGAPLLFKYFHLKDLPNYKEGDSIKAGDRIGTMGASGDEGLASQMGVHLHYEVELAGLDLNVEETIVSESRTNLLHPFNKSHFTYKKNTLPVKGFLNKEGTPYDINITE